MAAWAEHNHSDLKQGLYAKAFLTRVTEQAEKPNGTVRQSRPGQQQEDAPTRRQERPREEMAQPEPRQETQTGAIPKASLSGGSEGREEPRRRRHRPGGERREQKCLRHSCLPTLQPPPPGMQPAGPPVATHSKGGQGELGQSKRVRRSVKHSQHAVLFPLPQPQSHRVKYWWNY